MKSGKAAAHVLLSQIHLTSPRYIDNSFTVIHVWIEQNTQAWFLIAYIWLITSTLIAAVLSTNGTFKISTLHYNMCLKIAICDSQLCKEIVLCQTTYSMVVHMWYILYMCIVYSTSVSICGIKSIKFTSYWFLFWLGVDKTINARWSVTKCYKSNTLLSKHFDRLLTPAIALKFSKNRYLA